MTAEDRVRYARIMAECGCRIDDICTTLDMTDREVWRAILPCISISRYLKQQASRFLNTSQARRRIAA